MVLSSSRAVSVARLRAGHPFRAAREALDLARSQRTSSVASCLATVRLGASSYERSAQRTVRDLRRGAPGVEPPSWRPMLDWGALPGAVSWLTAHAAELVACQAEQLANRPPEYTDPERTFDWWSVRRISARTGMLGAVAASYGIELHDPYGDLRVLELGLAIPSHLREPRGSFKPLAREFADLVPPELAARKSKDRLVIHDAWQFGLQRHASTLRALVASDSSQLVRAGLIDRGAISEALEEAIIGARYHAELVTLIEIELRLAKPRQTWWKDSQ